jgi:hypothetical protein
VLRPPSPPRDNRPDDLEVSRVASRKPGMPSAEEPAETSSPRALGATLGATGFGGVMKGVGGGQLNERVGLSGSPLPIAAASMVRFLNACRCCFAVTGDPYCAGNPAAAKYCLTACGGISSHQVCA